MAWLHKHWAMTKLGCFSELRAAPVTISSTNKLRKVVMMKSTLCSHHLLAVKGKIKLRDSSVAHSSISVWRRTNQRKCHLTMRYLYYRALRSIRWWHLLEAEMKICPWQVRSRILTWMLTTHYDLMWCRRPSSDLSRSTLRLVSKRSLNECSPRKGPFWSMI